ncbi:serine/threonine-protein phosphatase 7 long form homolog [Arachis stenosperma]|uniref:serine/threonine-protein phosphatase 7 long form homolog n=1 Tax=Arachis stenosperma TaxID=217475 RepID=UPI0025AC6F55|nr:serine/threonine-protein phosphatase 7 long form homolog [Arachis stenosperma]
MINALIERWRPETHTFHFPVGECVVTLEDVTVILGLPTNGLPVTGPTMSSFEALEAECLHQFGIAPSKSDCRGSFIKLTWFRGVRDRIVLNDDVHMQMYVKCHIMLLFGKVLFADKSGAGVHWKFLPLLRNFGGIIQFSWGSACLAHLYRSLCRATRVDCKEMDGPLTLLVSWAWIRLPFLAPIPGNPRVFPIANRWHNWDRQNYAYRYKTLAHYRRLLDDLEEGQLRMVLRNSRPGTSMTSIVPPYLPTVLLLHFGYPDQPVTTIPIFYTFAIECRRFRLIYPIVHTSPDGIIFHCLDYCLP